MKMYLVSLAVGVLVGVIYGLLQVRSPAPPIVALLGLLGMLVGEQLVPLGKRLIHREPTTAQWLKEDCLPQVTGCPPKVPATSTAAEPPGDRPERR